MKKIYSSVYEKIFESSIARGREKSGDYYPLRPSLVLGHDPLIAMIVDDFKAAGFKIDKNVRSRLLFVADHFAPPSTAERADILKKFLDFSYGEKIENVKVFEGICHQLMVESEMARPFSYIAGSDSHTVMAGAISSIASGYGSMDILSAMTTGVIYEKKFPVRGVNFYGDKAPFITGRDLGLEVIRLIGEGEGNNTVLEYSDNTSGCVFMDDRYAISNASIECGASAGIFSPDEILLGHLIMRGGPGTKRSYEKLFDEFTADVKPDYEVNVHIDAGSMNSKIALPHDFSKIIDVAGVSNVSVDQVFVGSCASGRISDFQYMCEAIGSISKKARRKNVKKDPKVRLIVTPSSQKIYLEAIKLGYIEKLIGFGAVITNPSCGPCGGIDKGLIGSGEVCLSTSTRNFRGRMGSMDSDIYIASPLTAIFTAYAGKITAPEEFYL
ncbi:MAG TPA: aconitase family protein [Candidatus Wallbacteria bacterium]|nr:aconitase family protein [Candidatus Wallbacteria bacterium]